MSDDIEVETDQDVSSQRRTQLVWTGLGFAVLILIGVPACALVPLASHASPTTSNFLQASFHPSVPALGPGGARLRGASPQLLGPAALAKKALVVDEVKGHMEDANLMFCMRSEGITVNEVNEMRQKLPEHIKVRCVKNTLVKRAAEDFPNFQGADDLLHYPNYWFFVPEESMRETVEELNGFLKVIDKDETNGIIGGMFEGQVLDSKGVVAVTKLLTKQELMGQTASLLKALPTKLASALDQAGAQRLARATNLAAGQNLVQAVKAVEDSGKSGLRRTPPVMQMSSAMERTVFIPAVPALRNTPPAMKMSSPAFDPLNLEPNEEPQRAQAMTADAVPNTMSNRMQPGESVIDGDSVGNGSTLGWLSILALGAAGAFIAGRTTHSFGQRSSVQMKVYDWKTRGEEAPALESLDLGNLKASPGSHKSKTRKGRGVSAGQGVTCGFGNNGQKARSGRSVRPGFEGGQIPLYRRLPKFVGRPMGPSHSYTKYDLIKLNKLNDLAEGSTVNYASLREEGIVSKPRFKLNKVVAGPEEYSAMGLTVKAHAFTEFARTAIEGNGGTCVVLSKTTHRPL